MNKKLVALAVAAAVAPFGVHAEVTVSGVLQAEIVSLGGDIGNDGLGLVDGLSGINNDAGTGVAEGSGVGAINFTASEDLGGGLTAIAKYAMNVNATTSPKGGPGERDSYVGLSGGFGTILAGRLSTPYKTSTVKWDPFVGTALQARGNDGLSGGALGHSSYMDNAVAYANKFGSAKVVAAVVLDETVNDNHAMSVSLNMPVGPVEVSVAYLDATDHGALGAAADRVETKVGVKYAAGDLSVAAIYEDRDGALGYNHSRGFIGEAVDSETFLYLTGSYTMGANTFSASYGMNAQDYVLVGDVDNTYMAIGMTHAFSKTTRGHIGYRATENDGWSETESVIAAGLRVAF